MTRDLIIGFFVSISLHSSFFFYEKLFPKEETVAVVTQEEEFTVDLMEMPPLEPEPEEILDATDDAPPEEIEFAPPMQADVPSVQVDPAFVQKLQPPPPPVWNAPPESFRFPRPAPAGRSVRA